MGRTNDNDSLSDVAARLQMALHIAEHGGEQESADAWKRASDYIEQLREGMNGKVR